MLDEVDYSKFLDRKRPCVICGSEHFTEFCTDGVFDVLECVDCGLVFVNPCLSKEGLDIVYAGHHEGRLADKDEWKNRNLMYEIDRDFLCGTVDRGSILDVGCGGGFFLSYFDSKKWSRTGLEIDPDTAPFAEENFGLNVYIGTSEDMPFDDMQFDVVSFRGSFEHLVNPQVTIQEVDRVLKPGGYLYLCATPNVDSYCARLYRSKWNQFDAKEHIFMFSEKTLRKMLAPMGYRKVSSALFYQETPYADIAKDINQVAYDQKLISEGRYDEVGISPPFWGNMLNIVFRKPN